MYHMAEIFVTQVEIRKKIGIWPSEASWSICLEFDSPESWGLLILCVGHLWIVGRDWFLKLVDLMGRYKHYMKDYWPKEWQIANKSRVRYFKPDLLKLFLFKNSTPILWSVSLSPPILSYECLLKFFNKVLSI